MKKRLLITSIVMMLVVAVALSTATYAWFTSNTKVEAGSLTMTAATNVSSALGIDWIGGSGASSQITFNGSAEAIQPMVPSAITSNTTTAPGGSANEMTFSTATVKSTNGHFVFNSAGATATPYTFTNGSSSAFYVSNLNTANAVANVQVQATISTTGGSQYAKTSDVALNGEKTYYTRTGTAPNFVYTAVAEPNVENIANYYEKSDASLTDGTSLIRIAIFKRDTAGSGDYKLKGILASTANATSVAYGSIAAGANAEKGEGASLSYGEAVDYIDLGGLTANDGAANGTDQMDIVAVVWMDGYELDDNNQGKGAVISLTFLQATAGSKASLA